MDQQDDLGGFIIISATTSWITVRAMHFLSLASVVGADQTLRRSVASAVISVANTGDGLGVVNADNPGSTSDPSNQFTRSLRSPVVDNG
ncbi:hypothetical protein, partial [Mesorhizobium tianshanense]